MVKVNDQIIEIGKFPDGTLHITPPSVSGVTITWFYENNEEMITVLFLARHYQNIGMPVRLVMPYIPNARQDRVKSNQDLFTLKYFSEFINKIGFISVTVLDPHSSVSEALINNLIIENPKKYIKRVLGVPYDKENPNSIVVFYPDEGAMKRYSGLISCPYVFGIKRRDWTTGKIEGLDVVGEINLIAGHDVLIIDDICSRGGTFYHSAKKLKELGANHIYLYVSHCEPTILDGEIFTSGLIDKVFTTDTIFRETAQKRAKELGVANKMGVMKYERD